MDPHSVLILVHLDKDPEEHIKLPCGAEKKRSDILRWIKDQNGESRTGKFDSMSCKCCKFLNYIIV